MMQESQENELARRCAAGDARAREELYETYAARLYSLCLRYTADRTRARDLLHDAMIKALRKIGSFESRHAGSLYAWLSRIAVNTCISDLRKSKIFRTVPLEDGPLAEEDPDGNRMERIPPEVVRGFIESLPAAKRTVFNLYCIEGFSHKEIAGMLGITPGASSSILAKARNNLKAMINNYLSHE